MIMISASSGWGPLHGTPPTALRCASPGNPSAAMLPVRSNMRTGSPFWASRALVEAEMQRSFAFRGERGTCADGADWPCLSGVSDQLMLDQISAGSCWEPGHAANGLLAGARRIPGAATRPVRGRPGHLAHKARCPVRRAAAFLAPLSVSAPSPPPAAPPRASTSSPWRRVRHGCALKRSVPRVGLQQNL